MSMNLLRKGLWSNTYQVGKEFVKRLNFFEPLAAEREEKASRLVYGNGIYTPKHLYTILEKGGSVSMHYEYLPMKKLTNEDVMSDEILLKQVMCLFGELSKIPWDSKDEYWYNHITKEFEYELSLLDFDTHNYVNYLHSLVPAVFIHGDCSVYNMGLYQNKLIIFDFQHGSWGPEGWDRAYFVSTMKKDLSYKIPLTIQEIKMVELIAAVKLGRAIKKGLAETSMRREIFETWRTMNF